MTVLKHLVIGILAHVDAGKTTLSEGILYNAGAIRKTGRVDHGDTFLDTFVLEKQRGITIFSKQAEFRLSEDITATLLDTPGHVDFSPEMERSLQVLDHAILIISQQEGVNGHVKTLWKLLKHYGIPVFIFVNKMDQAGADKEKILAEIRDELDDAAVDLSGDLESDSVQESLASADEILMEKYFSGEVLKTEDAARLVSERKIFPVYFGSALRMEGVDQILDALRSFAVIPSFPKEFGARVYKITRDQQGERLTWLKITGGTLKVKSIPEYHIPAENNAGGKTTGKNSNEKINQIRVYSGDSYQLIPEALPGMICAVTGLTTTYAGQGMGYVKDNETEFLQPVLNCAVILRPDEDRTNALKILRMMEEEEPMLHISYDESTKEITAGVMGEVQIEILRAMLEERFGLKAEFGPGKIVYKETIRNTVEGVGHFEPLRHYAEVHLLMEPGEPGSGLVFDSRCSTDHLSINWQRLIRTHLEERVFRGVLTGSEITDMKITVIGGRAHDKHTEGGDFRQATYRAVRQGLMMAENILLEPVYSYRMELPSENLGRAMNDVERMGGSMDTPGSNGVEAILTGTAPASEMMNYQQELTSYTGGKGRISFELKGYEPCHNAAEIIESIGYDPERDISDPASSVFCSHGVGTVIPWDMVREYMHTDSGWRPGLVRTENGWKQAGGEDTDKNAENQASFAAASIKMQRKKKQEDAMSFSEREAKRGIAENELKEIFERTYRKSDKEPSQKRRRISSDSYDDSWRDYKKNRNAGPGTGNNAGTAVRGSNTRAVKKKNNGEPRKEYLLVDGYNIIFAWDELRELASRNIDSARDKLLDLMSDHQGNTGCTLIVVFDAYKVAGGSRRIYKYQNINVVYTGEAETADAYIEKTVHDIGHRHNVTVATSDGLEQMIILGEGAVRLSARELKLSMEEAKKQVREELDAKHSGRFNSLLDSAPEDVSRKLENVRRGKK